MTKAEFIKEVAEAAKLSQTKTEDVMEVIKGVLLNSLEFSGEAILPGIGKFRRVTVKERSYRNPSDGNRPVVKPEHQKIKITLSGKFK